MLFACYSGASRKGDSKKSLLVGTLEGGGRLGKKKGAPYRSRTGETMSTWATWDWDSLIPIRLSHGSLKIMWSPDNGTKSRPSYGEKREYPIAVLPCIKCVRKVTWLEFALGLLLADMSSIRQSCYFLHTLSPLDCQWFRPLDKAVSLIQGPLPSPLSQGGRGAWTPPPPLLLGQALASPTLASWIRMLLAYVLVLIFMRYPFNAPINIIY
jgi:hypothetical protein